MSRSPARLTVLLVAAYVGIGMPIGALGVAWPQIRADVGEPLEALGLLLMAFTGGNLVASIAHGRIAPRRIDTGTLLVGAEAAGAVGLALFAVSPGWTGLLLGMTLLGVAVAGLDAELNSYVAVHHGPRLLHLMHGGFGIGATLGPLAISALLRTDLSWRVVYGGIALVWCVVLGAFVVRRARWATSRPLVTTDAPPTGAPAPDPTMSRRLRLVLVLGLAFFFVYSGVELGAGNWAFTWLTADGWSEGVAGVAVTCYWGALTLGRFALGALGHRVGPALVVHASVAATLVSAAVMVAGGPLAIGALVLLGLSQAGIFPAMVALTPLRLGRLRAHRVMGLQFASANIGGALLPAAIGVAAGRRGESAVAPAVLVVAALLAAVHVALWAVTTHRARPARLVTRATAA